MLPRCACKTRTVSTAPMRVGTCITATSMSTRERVRRPESGRSKRQQLEQTVPLAALFTAFLAVSLCGVGGGGVVWARRVEDAGTIGTIAAVSGFLVIPWVIGLSVGLLFLEYAHLTVLRNILGGVAATAAGLLIATGIRLLLPHRRRPAALLFAVLAFGLITFAKLPLLAALFGLVPLSIAVAGIEKAKAR